MTNNKSSNYGTLIFFAIVAWLLLRPILGDVWYPTHDTTHIARLYLMESTIRGGQFPPIWSDVLNGGLGYPLFHFYAPLFYYLSLLLKLFVGSYFVAIKTTLFLSLLAGMWGMYLLVKNWAGRASAVISAISFGTLPYVALNLYVRGAYAELLSVSLLPWLFYAWQKLSTRSQIIAGSTVTALFILSHNLIPLITLPFLLVWILYHHWPKLTSVFIPIILTLLLSAFYVLPLAFERNFVQAEAVARTTRYDHHFVYPTQLWNSTWGFGGSGVGVEDGMSFKVGKLHLLLAVLSTLILLVAKSRQRPRVILLAGSALAAAFMATPFAEPIWDQLSLLQVVQFPWRYLAVLGFFVSALSGLFLSQIRPPIIRHVAMLITIFVLFYLNLKLFAPQTTFTPDLSSYTSSSYLSTISSIVPEYLPRWMSRESALNTPLGSKAYYPTWIVKVDGSPVSTWPSDEGLLMFDNPGGSSSVDYIQSHTPLEKIGFWISSLTILSLLLSYVKAKKHAKI